MHMHRSCPPYQQSTRLTPITLRDPREFICDLGWIATGWLTSRHIGRGDQDPVNPAVGHRCQTTTRATADHHHRRHLSRSSPPRPIASVATSTTTKKKMKKEEGRDDQIVTHHGQSKEGIVDPPNDCNSLASGTDPSSTELDAKELASGKHSSDTEP